MNSIIPGSSSTPIFVGKLDSSADFSDACVPKPAINDLRDLSVPPGCPYVGWSYYFPPSFFADGNKPPATCVSVFVRYFHPKLSECDLKILVERHVFDVNVLDLCADPGNFLLC